MMSDEMLINLEAFPGEGRNYPVTIKAEDEGLVREAARQLRQKFIAYKQAFSGSKRLSDKDLMAMTALDITTDLLRLENKNDAIPFSTKIKQLNEELKDLLKEE
jgi:cell division protein ZapA